MLRFLREFDELYSISDLHIGGSKGFQIFDQGRLLARLIEHLRGRPARRRVALIINGDTVDFLAEEPSTYFDTEGAVAKLDRIFDDTSFSPVWQALEQYLAKTNRYLIVTLGNHDLELALPWVREHFLDKLSGGKDAARGRIMLRFDGSGFACSVGRSAVLCVHGNDVDSWNWTDYERLRDIGGDYVQQRQVEKWTPNAGTKLVIDVMNDVKRDFPFVDLLKPETQAALPIVAELAPDRKSKIEGVWAALRKKRWDDVKKRFRGFLSGEEEAEERRSTGSLNAFLGGSLSRSVRRQTEGKDADSLLDEIEDEFGKDPLDLVGREQQAERLGWGDALWKRFTGAETHEVLYEAMQGLKKDTTFNLDDQDQTFKDIDRQIGGGFDFITTGHTHLERVLPRSAGDGHYFNSGTWVPLIRLTDDILGSEDNFKKAFRAFKNSKTLDELKKKRIGGKQLVMYKPAVVRVVERNGVTTASLCRVEPDGEKVKLREVK